ncbi:hypothetical protein [Mesorhizobium argentiipisi]|uniref:Pyridoxamine 5'-phosphate oxidase putative domain-containing protein n=1 Tax=Mesorhizobium argentiipisi TaxID=3015175 RepID=A0ABU8KLF0_9HYPH
MVFAGPVGNTSSHDVSSGDPSLHVRRVEDDHKVGRIGQFQANRRVTLRFSRLSRVAVDHRPALCVSLEFEPVVRHEEDLERLLRVDSVKQFLTAKPRLVVSYQVCGQLFGSLAFAFDVVRAHI